jgi:type IV pilus assembly protein PilP
MTLTRWSLCLLGAAVLAGCGASSEDELRTWMLEQRSQMRPRVPPISEPKPFRPENYVDGDAVDPFSREKLTSALKREAAPQASTTSALIAPELARRKEALEAYPLDVMTMVGSLIQEGQPAALIKVDKLLYQVRLGSHLGMNYGRVTKITETEVTLREIVQDAVGEWIERPATLQLQERVK